MKILTTGLVALFGLVLVSATGCSASPEALCNDSLEITCDKVHECTTDKTTDADADGTPDFEEMWGTDSAACQTMLNDGFTVDFGGTTITIDGASCDTMTDDNACDSSVPNYDSGAAADCIDGYESQTCDQFNDSTTAAPAACADVCTA